MESEIVSLEKKKPVLDEQTFAKLLEAAYVLQEHNREMQELECSLELKGEQAGAKDRAAVTRGTSKPHSPQPAPPNYALTLAQIVETQHQIQVRHLELEDAITLVAERVMDVARASGAAIGILDGRNVNYRAVAGLKAPPKQTTVPMEKALCFPCLKTGQVCGSTDVSPELLLDAEECRRRGIESMMAVPIFRDGRVAGGLELYDSAYDAFTEQDVLTCQLMAGLVTEALVCDEEHTWKKSLATERAAMLEALEKLQPNLAALIHTSAAKDTPAKPQSPAPAGPQTCRKCGHKIVGEEQFCGQCGLPRSSDYAPANMQSKVASLWQMQAAQEKAAFTDAAKTEPAAGKFEENPDQDLSEALAHSLEEQMPGLFAEPDVAMSAAGEPSKLPAERLRIEDPGELTDEWEAPSKGGGENSRSETVALTKSAPVADWSSAASARGFLEQLAAAKRSPALLRFWNTRRGDIYLAVAILLVACVIRWGLWSGHWVGATGAPNTASHRKSPEADLSLFDRMLIQLGLAEPPETPEDRGNPSVQVWVDTHSALYYCPGADLYGKTPKGKFATQRDAQLDQFQPAYRKACH